MKKSAICFALVFAFTFFLTGCKKSVFYTHMNQSLELEIGAENAQKGTFGATGSLTVSEGQKIVVESALKENSEISLKLITDPALGIDATAEELSESLSGDDYVMEIVVKDQGTAEYEIEPGEYNVRAEVLSNKANGTILVTVK